MKPRGPTINAERLAALQDAAEDVCPYCSGRYPPKTKPDGPNSAGNYTHVSSIFGKISLCPASAIHARIRFEATHGRRPEAIEIETINPTEK